MQTTRISRPTAEATELRQYTHLVWGYGTLIGRSLAANEDPRPLLDVLIGVTERVGTSLSNATG
jgi:hypothetical protein